MSFSSVGKLPICGSWRFVSSHVGCVSGISLCDEALKIKILCPFLYK